MNIDTLHTAFLKSSGVSTDTRSLKQGSIFFSLKGENFNGNKYASQALEKGASFSVIDDSNYKQDERYIVVKDSLKCLQELAKYHRKKLSCPVIGITGTNGKTTTKELIFATLSTSFKTTCTKGNLNNDIGVPLTILSTPLDAEMLIVEMGANHMGEITFLCNIAQIDYGIITNIGKAHLEGFGSHENIIKTKNELYQYVYENNKKLFVNKNDKLLIELSQNISREFYLDYQNITNDDGLCYVMVDNHKIKTNLVGSYNKTNVAAAFTIASYFDIDKKKIVDSLKKYKPSNNRSELRKTEVKNILTLDAYNANPSSMSLSIDSFLETNKTNRWLILGDMLELGDSSNLEHQNIIDSLHKKNIKNVIIVGKEFGKCTHNYKHFNNVDLLSQWIIKNPITDSKILLKGSRGIKLEQLEKNNLI